MLKRLLVITPLALGIWYFATHSYIPLTLYVYGDYNYTIDKPPFLLWWEPPKFNVVMLWNHTPGVAAWTRVPTLNITPCVAPGYVFYKQYSECSFFSDTAGDIYAPKSPQWLLQEEVRYCDPMGTAGPPQYVWQIGNRTYIARPGVYQIWCPAVS